MESNDRNSFWTGYEIGLSGQFPQTENEFIWDGWEFGAVERAGIFRTTIWELRRRRIRAFLVRVSRFFKFHNR